MSIRKVRPGTMNSGFQHTSRHSDDEPHNTSAGGFACLGFRNHGLRVIGLWLVPPLRVYGNLSHIGDCTVAVSTTTTSYISTISPDTDSDMDSSIVASLEPSNLLQLIYPQRLLINQQKY